MLIHQLGHVFIASGDNGGLLLGTGLTCQRTDDIICFNTRHRQQRKPHRPDNVMNRFDLCPQIIRHRRPLSLVFRIDFIPESLSLGIEYHRNRAVRILLDQTAQHTGHQTHRTGRLALRISHICLLGGKECTV